jgi:hypothetical protein
VTSRVSTFCQFREIEPFCIRPLLVLPRTMSIQDSSIFMAWNIAWNIGYTPMSTYISLWFPSTSRSLRYQRETLFLPQSCSLCSKPQLRCMLLPLRQTVLASINDLCKELLRRLIRDHGFNVSTTLYCILQKHLHSLSYRDRWKDDYQLCGKAQNFCAVSRNSKTTVGENKRGWYISSGKHKG